MLDIRDEVKTEFLRDSSAKELAIDCSTVDDVDTALSGYNFYMNTDSIVIPNISISHDSPYFGHDIILFSMDDTSSTPIAQNCQYREDMWKGKAYVRISYDLCFTDVTASDYMIDWCFCTGFSGESFAVTRYSSTIEPYIAQSGQSVPLDSDYVRNIDVWEIDDLSMFTVSGDLKKHFRLTIWPDSGETLSCNVYIKNIKVTFSNKYGAGGDGYISPVNQPSWEEYYLTQPFIITNNNLVSESFSLNESLCSEQNIKFGLCEAAYCQFTVADDNQDYKDRIIKPKLMAKNIEDSDIPLGIFKVSSVKKHHIWDMVKQEITAYDNLTVLENNAADWYTQYMFGIETDDYVSSMGFEYARQIFSTYYNYAKSVGLENASYYTDTEIYNNTYTPASIDSDISSLKMSWEGETISGQYIYGGHVDYLEYSISDPDPTKLYKVSGDIIPITYLKEQSLIPRSYYDNVDSLARGLCSCNILVYETLTSGTNKFCVDVDDYFMISPDCQSFKIYLAARYFWNNNTYTYLIRTEESASGTIIISKADSAPDLPNGQLRLLYYNYNTKDIFACESSITGRDVVRSLLEVNGCFFRLSRYTGQPEFIYCTKSGLYPSNKLYPADDLYPREGASFTINMGQYQSFEQEDYMVQKYGKIQIRKNTTSNETKSIVEWEYTGDDSYENVYAIDDNIFYCNEKMEYDYDNMTEVSEMLANMWGRISNMDYVPCTLVCKGMPWVECGDRIGVLTKTGGAESFVFHRTLKGIQALKDTYESEGDEYTEAISDYGYKEWEGN